jgi:hypothetical protein
MVACECGAIKKGDPNVECNAQSVLATNLKKGSTTIILVSQREYHSYIGFSALEKSRLG